MLIIAGQGLGLDDAWMTGDRPEDHQAAIRANVKFMTAEIMRAKFTPGEDPIKSNNWYKVNTTELLEFLAL